MYLGLGSPTVMAAVERGLPRGHVHVFFPALEATMPDGSTETIIDDGSLTTLDDPEVRGLAAEHGDPDELVSVDWVPPVPGISVDEYNEYAAAPSAGRSSTTARPETRPRWVPQRISHAGRLGTQR